MATVRKISLRNGEFYHVFNRGLERRPTFTDKREFSRACNLIKFYRHTEIPVRYSKIIEQPVEIREKMLEELYKSERLVDIICYCLMPNHFHFLLKQLSDNGIAKFISNFTNAYTKYFNTKNERSGPLFQGTFKAVHVESDEQLIHLSRYIHLNPVVSGIAGEESWEEYPWSSYREYIDQENGQIVEKSLVLNMFSNIEDYKEFVRNQIGYAKKLEVIKHLTLE